MKVMENSCAENVQIGQTEIFIIFQYLFVLSMIFAIEEINRDPKLLPNVTLGFQIFDSCYSREKALLGTLSYLTGKQDLVPNYSCETASLRPAVIGDTPSSSSLIMATVLGLYRYPQVSYASAVSLLSNKLMYPSFMRTVPNDDFQAVGIAQLLIHFGWTWVGILASDNDFGILGSQILQTEMIRAGGCIAFIEMVTKDKEKIPSTVNVIQKSSANVIVVYSTAENLVSLLDAISSENVTGRIWISSTGWHISLEMLTLRTIRMLNGGISFAIHKGDIPGLTEFLHSIHPFTSPNDIFIRAFWEEAFACQWLKSDGNTSTNKNVTLCTGYEDLRILSISVYDVYNFTYMLSIYNAVYVVAYSLHNLLSCKNGEGPFQNKQCGSIHDFLPWKLLHYAKNVNFKNSGDENMYLDANGDPPARYDILNFALFPDGSNRYFKVGSYENKAIGRPELTINIGDILWNARFSQEVIPQELKDVSIVHLYKRKGNRQSCDNHRGISLLVIAGKILARVLLTHLIQHMEDGHLLESHCSFREGRGTLDMIFAENQIQEKCQEQNKDLYTMFVDQTNAFDTISHEGLKRIMESFSCPGKFISMVHQFHDGMLARVLDDGDSSAAFPVTNRVKQGCVLAPMLFSKIFSAMVADGFCNDEETSIKIRYRTDGRLFNLWRLQAKTKVEEDFLCNFLFADDCALNAATEAQMQLSMNCFSTARRNFGFTINAKKTEVCISLHCRRCMQNQLSPVKVPHSVCTESCQPGYQKVSRQGQPLCCFDCLACSKGEITNQTDAVSCLKCTEDLWSNEKRDRCIPKILDYLSYEDPIGASLFFCSSTLSVLTVSILCIFIKFKDTPIVKANNRELSYLLLLALMFCFLCSLLFIGRPMKLNCMFRQMVFGLTFSLCVSCILAKTVTVVIAFSATKPGSRLRNWVGSRVSTLIVIVGSLVQVIICFVWLSLSAPFPEFKKTSEDGKIIIECNEVSAVAFWSMLGYLGLLAVVSFVVAFLARNLPGSFSEAKYITFSMLVFVSVWLSFIPAYLSTRGKYMVVVEIFAILTSSAGMLGCIFLHKCYIIILRPELNTRGYLIGKSES
ncbi:uncharacterized protein LOC122805990 [Protopterus annectens]|uniref:uncharacterized protein LOC122805990 n=1 Tax=Protopterus annectens TaxID=7888 RepID=UPI001CFA0FFD|nr:uncharacterized protein LOC122805990 [Protopterus annectens]